MKALVTYESLYGNTAEVAGAVAEGLASLGEVVLVPAGEEAVREAVGADLIVVGGPTHVHGLPTDRSRRAAVEAAAHDGEELHVEGEPVRRLLESLPAGPGLAAAFDTRARGPRILTGSAADGIGRRLRHRGLALVADPESFVVSANQGPLVEGERTRAMAWGARLAALVEEKAR